MNALSWCGLSGSQTGQTVARLLLGCRELCLRGKFEKIISTASWERGIMNEVSLG